MSSVLLNSKAMPSKPNSKVDFRDLELKNQINSRYPEQSEGIMAKRDLKRYYNFLPNVLEELNFSGIEAVVIAEALREKAVVAGDNEELLPIQTEIVAAIILDRVHTGSLVKDAFLAKVKKWKPYQLLAISDAVERVWNMYNSEPEKDRTIYKCCEKIGLFQQ